MCASGAQNSIQQEDIQTMQGYAAQQATQYENQTALYAQVKSVLDPILNAGPNQQGFSAAELNDLNAQAVEGTAENYSAAGKAVGENLAGEGGGDNPLPSGAQTQLKQQAANSAAEQESSEETQIQGANYQQGRENFTNAEQGEMAIAAGENPTAYSSAAINAEGTAGSEANAIASENTSWINAAVGAAGAIGTGIATGGMSNLGKGEGFFGS
jgi:hypothetical protein